MKIEVTSHELPHPPEDVWPVLLDPAALSRLLPGVEKLEPSGPDRYAVVVELGVGPVRGAYTGSIEIADPKPPESYRLVGEAKGKPGWAKGSATLVLRPSAAGTTIAAQGEVQIGGPVASVGQRMIDGVAKSMAREFFQSLDRELAARAEGRAAAAVSASGFGVRVLLDLIRRFFARLFGRGGS